MLFYGIELIHLFMLKQKSKLFAMVLCAMFVACNDDDTMETETSYPVEISISFSEKDSNFQYLGWNENRQIAAFRTDNRTSEKVILTQSDGQYYSGTSSDEISENADFGFLYPASVSTSSSSDTITQMLYLDKQEGTIDGMASLDFAWGKYTYDTSDEDYVDAVTMTPLVSMCKFRFVKNGLPLERISKVVITSPTDSLYVYRKLNLADGEIGSELRGSILVCNDQGLPGEVYAAIFPTETALHFTLTTLDGKCYEARLPETLLLEAGEGYVSNDLPCTELQPARIGDYYYSDATWSSLPDGSKTCVGIVYALNDANGNIDRSLSESAYGRVVAIEDAAEQVAWCTTDEDLEGIANQTVLQDTMYVGSLPYYNGTDGSFFSDVEQELLNDIQIDTETGQIIRWYTQGTLNDFDGQEHTQCISHSAGTFAANTSCVEYGKGLCWYLPSEGELALLWSLHRTGIISHTSHEPFNDFAKFGYWTSNEYDDTQAWHINFYSGMTTMNSKNAVYNVRPVLKF